MIEEYFKVENRKIRYRLYIDESGSHEYSMSDHIKHKYLSLTGVFISHKENENELRPRAIKLKKIVADDPDEPDELPILHREDIVNKKGCYSKLKDEKIQKEWDNALLSMLSEVDYCICNIVINKKKHFERYQKSAQHPYHYCLALLLERYVWFLNERNAIGDVVAESRGKKEDTALKDAYKQFYETGTYFLKPNFIQGYLSSKEIKIKNKESGYIGLELSDLLTLPAKFDVLSSYGINEALSDNFTKKIISLTQSKYRRHPKNGAIKGFGKKLLE